MKNINLKQVFDEKIISGDFLYADWPAPDNVKVLITTRKGGKSNGCFSSLNVGGHVGDNPEAVAQNRSYVQEHVGAPLVFLNQVHGADVVRAVDAAQKMMDADACVDDTGRAACVVMTADCLPVLLCDRAGAVVAAAHAGWRSLAGGVLQNTVAAMRVDPMEIMAYFGPAIGPDAFEVGSEVKDAFCSQISEAEDAFESIGGEKYLADIYHLARLILQREGVTQIYGGSHCTVLERENFFSYRRDGQTGRMASIIWLEQDH
ncbi:peptidoglycan editing factor PgeF [Neisseria canis]|uniref:Purine nucleoside phosphorylase n=1 Tax=Neisseria canis TaxID=493 RepID=A0A1X3CXF5_9NEIS|nr:peptidoglycan editing factor PgeF [Neisseria canis]OSI12215.1 multi-copper polyphenol oxidoreductase [Neisseria canis]VEF03600.1 Laccase domain protein yfiH [Neisseria canis]